MTLPFIAAIRAALETKLNSLMPVLPTQWENGEAYTPIAGTPYQVVYFLPAEPFNPESGGRYVQQEGYMQVTLRYPAGKGTADISARAQAVRDWFYKGLSLTANGITVTITRTPNIAPGAPDGDRYAVPIKIRFQSSSAT